MSSNLRLTIESFPLRGSHQQMELRSKINLTERSFVLARIAAQLRDPNALADAVFYRRHPEMHGRHIGKNEKTLAKEWLAILHDRIEPLLAAADGSSRLPTGYRDDHLDRAQLIARSPVPDMPAITTQQLVDKYRLTIAPEIPWPVLLAFIEFESGGNFSDATHGAARNNYTQPRYYELGLFQTPAGFYGTCSTANYKSCSIGPPGREAPGDPSEWVKICNLIGANPDKWENPVTQVRVGLTSIKRSADAIRAAYPDLFPTTGGDWYLRAAVLLPFARGGGFTRAFLGKYRTYLDKLPEHARWDFLHGKQVGEVVFDSSNVDEKMSLAAKLGYRP